MRRFQRKGNHLLTSSAFHFLGRQRAELLKSLIKQTKLCRHNSTPESLIITSLLLSEPDTISTVATLPMQQDSEKHKDSVLNVAARPILKESVLPNYRT